MQPGAVTGVSSGSGSGKHFLNDSGAWAAFAASDLAAVHFANRHNFGGGSSKESLIALEETVEKQRPGFHFPAQIAREPQYAIAGYAQENGVLRAIRNKHAVAHDEYVLTRALGDAAIGIQQERLVKSALNRVLHSEN